MKKTIALLSAITMIATLVGCSGSDGSTEKQTTKATVKTTTEITNVATESNATTVATTVTTSIQPNTTAMVDKISADAKEAAKTATQEELQQALDVLKDMSGEFYVSNESMETVMYNAQLLYYYYEGTDTPYEQAGFYAFTAVKYVYRGADSVDSTDTSDALTKLAMALIQCSDIVVDEAAAAIVDNSITLGMQNALQEAKDYLDFTAFSYTGLIEQLEYEGYVHDEAVYGADNCGANWNEQAAKCAQSYMDYSSFSRQELYDQLIYEGFTDAEAQYGLTYVGY